MKLVKDPRRGNVSVTILTILLVTIQFFLDHQNLIFYKLTNNESWLSNWPRYLWGIFFGLFGFLVASFIASFQARPDEMKYSEKSFGFYFGYLVLEGGAGIFGSLLVVSLLSSISNTSDWGIFYIFSACLCFYFGLIADIHLLNKILKPN